MDTHFQGNLDWEEECVNSNISLEKKTKSVSQRKEKSRIHTKSCKQFSPQRYRIHLLNWVTKNRTTICYPKQSPKETALKRCTLKTRDNYSKHLKLICFTKYVHKIKYLYAWFSSDKSWLAHIALTNCLHFVMGINGNVGMNITVKSQPICMQASHATSASV